MYDHDYYAKMDKAKACKKCGGMMYQVPSKRLYCDKCRDTVPRNMSTTEEKPKKLTLSEIMREADKEGLQYASYCKKHGLY